MSDHATTTIQEHFGKMLDPRRYNRRHKLLDIMVITICAVICGADDWAGVETWAEAKQNWLVEFLELPHGIPSQHTFRRVFAVLDEKEFQACFVSWMQAVYEVTMGQVIAIDGKQLRRSHDRSIGKRAIYIVSAWAQTNHLVLGQVKVCDKSNEITAIPELLRVLDLRKCIVTIDAIGCQKAITRTIVEEKHADYALALKANQGGLYAEVKELFQYAAEQQYVDCDYHKTIEKGHGRIEIRECWTIIASDYLAYLRDQDKWVGLQSLVMVKCERRLPDRVEQQTRYYISSLSGDAQQLLRVVRGHWGIENQLHWVLDIAFREDESRLRSGNSAQNFAVVRHIALNLLKQEKTAKCGLKNKRFKAACDPDYLLKVLAG